MGRLLIALVAGLWLGTAAVAQEYLLQPGDRIEVTVLEDPGLNRTVLVRPDGRITLPLAGSLVVAGRTPEAVAVGVRNALARQFVEPPNVTVSLVDFRRDLLDELDSAEIFVIGQVARPGTFQVNLPMDVLQALALAGGPGTFAARRRIQVRRRLPEGGETVFLFDYEMIERGLVPSADIRLADGDVIVVPERRLFE